MVSLTQTTSCLGESLTFVAAPAGLTEYTFFTDTNGDGIEEVLQSGSSEILSATVADNVQLFVRATNTSGCTDVAEVTVVSIPVPSFEATSFPLTSCGDPDGVIILTNLVFLTDYVITYTGPMGSVPSGSTITPNGNGAFALSGLAAETYTIELAFANSSTCSSQPISAEVEEDLTQVNLTLIDRTVCAGTTNTPIVSTSDCIPIRRFIIDYDAAANSAGLVDVDVTDVAPQYTLPANLPPGTYSGTAEGFCDNDCSDVASFTITVVENPTVTLTQTGFCEGEKQTFVASPAGFAEYNFCVDNCSGGLLQVSTSEVFCPFDVLSSNLVDGSMLLVNTSSNGCSVTAAVEVFTVPIPTISGTVRNSCDSNSGSFTFTNLSTDDYILTYSGPTGSVPSGSIITGDANGEFLLSGLATSSYSVQIAINLPDNCISPAFTFEIEEIEQPNITVNDATVCVGTTRIPITFTADCPVEHFLVEYDAAANAAGFILSLIHI